jgi:hypothetical protein
MADTDGSLDPSGAARAARPALLAACLSVLVALPAAAQQIQQPIVAPAPAAPEFLPRYDFHMSVDRLMRSQTPRQAALDQRFSWDSHFGGSFDLVDYVVGRAAVIVDYEAVMGSEYRPFDPNQGNYTLEASVSGRVSDRTEIAAIFHHVSRHISDRPKSFAVAWNELGARLLHRRTFGTATLDLDLEGGRVTQHSYVDYTWIGELNVLVRRPINQHVGLFGHGIGQGFLVDPGGVPAWTVFRADRGAQAGSRIEAGVRLNGRGGAAEIYVGYEKRADADPLDRQPQRWALLGFRLLSK